MENETNKPQEILETFIEIPLPAVEGQPTQYVALKFTRTDAAITTHWTCKATTEFIQHAQDLFNGH